MGKKDNHCSDCNAEIPATAPGGLCPKCLLNSGTSQKDDSPAISSENLDDDIATMAMDQQLPADFTKAAASAASFSASQSQTPEKKGAADFAPSQKEMEALFPDLEILDLLGAGGMGAVFKARQKRLDRLVALKILSCPPEMHDSFSLRFEREAQLLAKLHHPNIVTIFDFGEIKEDGPGGLPLFYFIMEYVDGSDLSKRIRAGSISVDETLSIVPQICDALQVAHDEGITHRDVKPANMLLDSQGQVRVADFGVAKIVDYEDDLMTGLTLTGTTMGTPHYMAPEQWDAPEKVDHRSDIYSLGVIFYQMLTGERPVGRFQSPSKKAGVDSRIDDIIYRALETKRTDRYQQASEMAENIREVVTTQASVSGFSKGKAIALGLVATAVIGVGAWWGMNQGGDEIAISTPHVAEKKTDGNGSSAPDEVTSEIFPAGKWVKVLNDQEELDTALGSNAGKNTLRDGWVDGSQTANAYTLRFSNFEAKNCGIRLRLKISDREPLPTILTMGLRATKLNSTETSEYRLALTGQQRGRILASTGLYNVRDNEMTPQSFVHLAETPHQGETFEVEFYAIGKKLIPRVNGQQLSAATDSRLVSGEIRIQNPHLIRDVELINLDGLNEAEALQIAGVPELDSPTHKVTPGRLRAAGTDELGKAIDLSRAEQYDDFVDVITDGRSWVALRQNGQTVSSNVLYDRRGISKLVSGDKTFFGFVSNDGSVEIFDKGGYLNEENLPESVKKTGVSDLALGMGHAIAVLRNGKVITWGPRYERKMGKGEVLNTYETEKWPKPPESSDLQDLKAIAAGSTHAAALHEDGSLTVWGYKGRIDPKNFLHLFPIKEIVGNGDSFHLLTESEEVYRLRLPRSDNPESPTGHSVKLNTLGEGQRLHGLYYQTSNGRWNAFSLSKNSEELLHLAPASINSVISGNTVGNSKDQRSWLLWIEPAPPQKSVPLSAPGKLTASGTYKNGTPVDISKAEGINDFVKVALQQNGWIGLREDGTTVSSDGKANRENVTDIYPIAQENFALRMSDLSFEFFASDEELNRKLNEEFPEEVRTAKLTEYFGMVRHSIALLEDGSVHCWGDLYDHPERLPEWVSPRTAWPRPPVEATENVISIGGGIAFAGSVTADGKLWLWDHEGMIDLKEWKKLQGQFVSLGKSSQHGTDAVLEDGQILHINTLTDNFSLYPAVTNEIVSTSETGHRSLYQDIKGRWYSAWGGVVAPFLELIEGRKPEEFSMNTTVYYSDSNSQKVVMGLITIEPAD